MNHVLKIPVEFLVGDSLEDMNCRPMSPYSDEVVGFLSSLSKRLFKNKAIRTYPDIASFAYWCRKSNLARLSRTVDKKHSRIGRGNVLHIAPSNVPVNFAFSLAFGLLSGNHNIVRVSEADHPQISIICKEIKCLLNEKTHERVAAMIRVIRYPRNDEITADLSSCCHARVLWGGDDTIANLRKMPTLPRCVDVCFADRYSLCLINAHAISTADASAMDALVAGFYNDVFLLDQNACSSPHLVLWQGKKKEILGAMDRFWSAMNLYIESKPVSPAIFAIDKFAHLCYTAIQLEDCRATLDQQNSIYRTFLDEIPDNVEGYRGKYGFFIESVDNDFSQLKRVVNERYQTITYFGIDTKEIMDCIFEVGMLGIDRIVPVGTALDIDVVWDGQNTVDILSRIITED